MDNIQSRLIKPFVEKMEKEWQDLYDQVRASRAPESAELCPIVENKLGQLRQLLVVDVNKSSEESVTTPEAMHEWVRQTKMDFRSIQRKWQKHLVSKERVKTRLSRSFKPSN